MTYAIEPGQRPFKLLNVLRPLRKSQDRGVTLNGDNRNDLWELANLFYFQPVSLHIYNRWGKLVFETSDYRNNWPESGLEPGRYFYRLTVSVEDTQRRVLIGAGGRWDTQQRGRDFKNLP